MTIFKRVVIILLIILIMKQTFLILFLFISCLCFTQNNKLEKSKKCNFYPLKVFLYDDANIESEIRNKLNGKIILKLNQTEDYYTYTITKAKNGWFKLVKVIGVEGNKIKIPGKNAWIYHTTIGMSSRKNITLLDAPQNGNIVGTVAQENSLRIIDRCSNFIKVEYNDIIGWVDSKWLCGNPVTTCP